MNLNKKNIAILGTVTGHSFPSMKAQLATMGAKASKTVGKNTSAAIVGKNAGDKLLLAQMAGIPIFTSEHAAELLAGGDATPLEPDAPELLEADGRESPRKDFETTFDELAACLGVADQFSEASWLWLTITMHLDAMETDAQQEAVARLERLQWPEGHWYGNTWKQLMLPDQEREVRYAPPRWLPGIFAGRDEPRFSLARLIHLDSHNLWGSAAARLFSCPSLQNTWHLSLRTKLTKDFFVALAESENLPRLRALHLPRSGCKGPSLKILAKSEPMSRLERLQLNDCPMGDEGMTTLVNGNSGALKELRLQYTGLTEAGVDTLCGASFLSNLRHLDLKRNSIGAADLRGLFSQLGPELSVLRLSTCGLGDEAALALAEATHLSGLRVIELNENQITDTGAAALAEAPHVTRAKLLWLHHNDVQRHGAVAIKKAMRDRASV